MVEHLAKDHFHKLAAKTFANPEVMFHAARNPQLYEDLVNIAHENRMNGTPHHTEAVLNTLRGVHDKWVPQGGPPTDYGQPDDRLHQAIFANTPRNFPHTRPLAQPGSLYEKLRNTLHGDEDPESGPIHRNVADAFDGGIEGTLRGMNHPLADDWSRARDKYRSLLMLQDAADRMHPELMRNAHMNIAGNRPYLRGNQGVASLRGSDNTGSQPTYVPQFQLPRPNDPSALIAALKGYR